MSSPVAAPVLVTDTDFTLAFWNTYVAGNLNYYGVAGADLASAASITPTNHFHKVTGTTTIDNLTPASPVAGQKVKLLFTGGPIAVRHNGGGTGNIRLQAGLHAGFVAGETLELVYDGTLWQESHRSPKHLSGEQILYSGAGSLTGALPEDGSAVSRTTYAAYFANVGTLHGAGDGSTTFNLPDSRGRMDVGYVASGGHTDVSTIGLTDGVAVAFRRPKHRTSMSDPSHNHGWKQQNGLGPPYNYNSGDGYRTGVTAYVVEPDVNVAASTGITVGTGNANDVLDSAAYIVRPKFTRI